MSKKTNKKITVLHLIDSAGIAGGERYLLDLIKYSSQDIEHIVILPYHGPFEQILDACGYRYQIINLVHKISPAAVFQLIKIIREYKVTIIHTHGFRANFYGRIAGILGGVINVATVHVSLYDYSTTPTFIRKIYLLLERTLSFKTSKFICISNAMKKDMQKLGIGSKKTMLIHNGVDLERFYPRSGKGIKRKILGAKQTGPVIATIGRMVAEKGHIYLVQALKHLESEWSGLRCLFVGDGPDLPKLKKKAEALGVEKMCIFLGVRKDVEYIYPVLDLFVLPSLREPFGLVLLEAMASGIPVIATDSGGPAEFIRSGVNGMLVPAKDGHALASQIRRLLLNKDTASKIGREGQKTVHKEFNVRGTANQVNSIYLTLAQKK